MNYFLRLIVFLLANLMALAIGGFLQGEGPSSDWYQALQKAPWTPPGVVFGIAWMTIMICLALYMTELTAKTKDKRAYTLYILQLVLNVAWNPVFFAWHRTTMALVVIVALFLLVVYMFHSFFREIKYKSFLLLPYVLWLAIAVSLNAFVCIMN